jgi:AraC-like DNA-binding protein
MKPGSFYALTGTSAKEVMDKFLPLKVFNLSFDEDAFFRLPFKNAKMYMKIFMANLCGDKKPNKFINLFDELSDDIPENVESIYKKLNLSPKQTQRLFSANFGLTPRLVLSILRFQKCLQVLTSGKANPSDMLNLVNFYDQAHFINDFKRNIGLTPFELVKKYC